MDDSIKIIEAATDLMMRFGVRSVSMDDIARELGMSKKTLYQLVENKEDLVSKIMHKHLEGEKCGIAQFQEQAKDAVEEMMLIARYVINMLRNMSPSALYDIKKYYRNVWVQWEKFHKKHIYNIIRRNLENGIREGLYRQGINPDIIAKVYVGKSMIINDEDLFPPFQYKRDKLFAEYIHYHMHGILSEAGIRLYKTYTETQ